MELFKLFGTILVDNDKANESISKTDKQAESLATKFKNGVATVGKWGTAITGASALVGGALMGVANSSAGAMDEIDKMSNKIGISKQGYQEWKYVLGQNGMEIDKLQTGMKTLVSQMDGANGGTKSAIENFQKLGVSIYDSTGKLKDQETMMNEVLFSLADMDNGTEKARLATELFGKSGIEMMPMLNAGSAGMKDLTTRAHELGLVVSDEAVTSGVVFGDTMDDLKLAFGMVGTQIGNSLIPTMQRIADWIIEHMPQIQEFIGKIQEFIGKVIDVAKDCVDWLIKNQDTVLLVADAVGILILAWGAFKFGELFNSFNTMKNGLVAWKLANEGVTISQGIMNGQITLGQTLYALLTGQMTLTELKTLLLAKAQTLLNTVMSANPIGIVIGLITLLVGAFVLAYNKSETFRNFVNNLWSTIKTVFTNIKNTITNTFSNIYSSGVAKFQDMMNKVKGFIDKIKGFFKFSVSLPKIKLPHFSIKPSGWSLGDLLKGKIPSLGISWYAKAMDDGMILNEPTIFGMKNGQLLGGGEVGSETVVGTNSLMNMIQTAVNSQNARNEELMEKMLLLLSTYIPQIAQNNPQLVLDTGVLVGQIAPKIDMELGVISRMKERGR